MEIGNYLLRWYLMYNKKNMKKIVFVLLLIGALYHTSDAQGVYDDFIYTRQAVQERKVIPWPYLREADVFWVKRITRIIDTREKQNRPMQWAKNPLNLILYKAITEGKIIAYINDSFTSQYTVEQYQKFFSYPKPVKNLIDPNGDPEDPTNFTMDTIQIKLTSADVVRYKILEDWIFDKKESRMFVRIIGIAPVVAPLIEGADIGLQDWGYLKYHEDQNNEFDCRELFVNMEVFNRQNDAARITYDDWFEQRLFSSYIIKEANQEDMAINGFAEFKDSPVAAMLEGERIKNDLFEREHDLWEF